MKLSIVIPQLFYDAIARVIPGVIFLFLFNNVNHNLLVSIFIQHSDGNGWLDTLGQGIICTVVSYVIGWLLSGIVFFSKEPIHLTNETNSKESDPKEDEKQLSVRSQYQWIRLADQEVGFRIVKLRAEARMLEGVRMAFFITILNSTFFYLVQKTELMDGSLSLVRLIFINSVCIVSFLILFYLLEEKAWKNYKGNIKRIYKLLHDKNNPIPINQNFIWPQTGKYE